MQTAGSGQFFNRLGLGVHKDDRPAVEVVHISEIRRLAVALKLRFGLLKFCGDRGVCALGFGQVFELQKQVPPAVFQAAREDVGCPAISVITLKPGIQRSFAAVVQGEIKDELQRTLVKA